MNPTSASAPEAIAGAPSLRLPLRPAYCFSAFNALTWMVALGTPMVLLAEALGASPSQIGLASSFVFLLNPVQVVATAGLHRLGYRRQMVLAWSVRALFLLVPLGFSLWAPDPAPPWGPGLLIASVAGFCAVRAIGVSAHIPWISALLPDAARGRFFATDHAIVSLVGIATLLGSAAAFRELPPYRAFSAVYAVALFGSVFAVTNLLRLPDAPRPPPLRLAPLARQSLALCLRKGIFRHYLLLCLLNSLVTSSLVNFTVYYLKVDAGLSSSRLLNFTAAQFCGMIAGTWGIRRFIDHWRTRRFFQIASLLAGLVGLFWLSLISGIDGLAPGLPLVFFVAGATFGVNNAAHFTYLPEIASPDERPVAIAVFTAVLGVVAGLAPILWGDFLEAAGGAARIDRERFRIFFGLAVATAGISALLFARLPDRSLHRDASEGGVPPSVAIS